MSRKKNQYRVIESKIYGLYGQSPYFLMSVLASQKLSEFFHSKKPKANPREELMSVYKLFDTVYKSAMELKVISLSVDTLSGKLGGLAKQRQPFQVGDDLTSLKQQLSTIVQERDIHVEQLPAFLHLELATSAGSVANMTFSQALTHYKVTLQRMAATKAGAVKPIKAPPPFKSGGITVNFSAQNPNIKAPLSKPELQALNELVDLQTHTTLGVKWVSYHDALLKRESARHLTAVAKAFGDLAERAGRAEKLIDAKLLADKRARAAETSRLANTFRFPGSVSATSPMFMTSAGTAATIDAATVTLQVAIRAAITALIEAAASAASGIFVGVTALVYSPELANGELPQRYALSTPLSDLAPKHGQNLSTIAAAGGTVDLPVRVSSKTAADGRSEFFVAKTDGVIVPSKVRVVAATFDAKQKVYSVSTTHVPPRTLTWTPIVNPGNSSTTLPAQHSVPPVYKGATVTPVIGRIDTFPGLVDASFDDFITVFPADSGLPPIYVMFSDRREDPGVVTGVGKPVTGIWLGAATQGDGAPIPLQIADQLRGKAFKNFRAFRKAFWTSVSTDFELSKQFNGSNKILIKGGTAPFVIPSEQVGGRRQFEIHHVIPVHPDGAVYDIGNMRILTPKLHIQTHAKKEGE